MSLLEQTRKSIQGVQPALITQNAREADAVARGDIQTHKPGQLRMETSVGWVAIGTVFPMGQEITNVTGAPNRSQPRQYFDEEELQALAADIAENGQDVPVLVRRVTSRHASHLHEYGLIQGERRLRAMRDILGKTEILVRVVDASMRRAYRRAVIHDVHNKAHSPVERGRSLLEFKRDMEIDLFEMLEKAGYENSKKPLNAAQLAKVAQVNAPLDMWAKDVLENAEKTGRRPTVNWDDVSTLVGLSRRAIADYVRAAGLGEEIVNALQKGELSARHAIILASVNNSGDRKKLFREVTKNNLSRQETRSRAQELNGTAKPSNGSAPGWKTKSETAPAAPATETAPVPELPIEPVPMKIMAAIRALEPTAQTEEEKAALRIEIQKFIHEAWESYKRLGGIVPEGA